MRRAPCYFGTADDYGIFPNANAGLELQRHEKPVECEVTGGSAGNSSHERVKADKAGVTNAA